MEDLRLRDFRFAFFRRIFFLLANVAVRVGCQPDALQVGQG